MTDKSRKIDLSVLLRYSKEQIKHIWLHTMFVGREQELKTLNRLLKKNTASLVVIKGRRRIGKSRLVEEFAKNHTFFSFSGLPPKVGITSQSQLLEFSRQISRVFQIPGIRFEDWGDAFLFVAHQTKSGRVILLFDEISWMGSKDPDFMGKFKVAWDLYFSKNQKLILILCGSISAWIENHILKSTGFVGRISYVLTLEELPLYHCQLFWGPRTDKISAYEKLKCLSVTGGIPRYLEEIQPQLTAEANIQQLCFQPEGLLYREFDQIFTESLLSHSDVYRKLLIALVDKPLGPQIVCQKIGSKLDCNTSRYLEELEEAGFISRDYTWHIKNGKISKLSHYRIKDNYIRFYLRYILANKDKIKRGHFTDTVISNLPGWYTILGLQFENLVLNNRKKLFQILNIHPVDIEADNPYFQQPTLSRPGCQIDYLIQTRQNVLYVCEIKFSKQEIGVSVIKELEDKINKLGPLKRFSIRPVLIYVNGITEQLEEAQYVSDLIDFSRLLYADF